MTICNKEKKNMPALEAYDWKALAERLAEISGGDAVKTEEPMKDHITFKVGGPAKIFADPASSEEAAAMIAACRKAQSPYYILGRGSNMLVGDQGYDGVIIHIGDRMAEITADGRTITAGAGIMLSSLARFAKELGLTGLEFASGIPGTLGGALAMNAGAYGGEMKDVVTSVQVLTDEGKLQWIPAGELAMGYRTSLIQKEGMVALAARLELKEGDPEQILALMRDLNGRRKDKQPLEYPSAGSTFKRPEGCFAGKMIQDAGLAGYTVGGACVSEKHCGFVINKDKGTAADILGVIEHVTRVIEEKDGVHLEMEVRKLGKF